MVSVIQGGAMLLTQFREFYGEIISLKKLIQSETLDPERAPAKTIDKTDDTESELLVNIVWKRLFHRLEQQELAVSQGVGEFSYELYKSAQFVMAALADEIFLEIDWEGREIWQSRLLETKLFQTSAAGGLFFKKLDTLLQHRDPVHLELAKVYLMALALGFRGKYRGEEEETAQLAYYRQELFTFIFRHSPELDDESKKFCRQAYSHSLEEGLGLKLDHPKKWVVLLIALILGMTFLSHGTWIYLTQEPERVIQEILSAKLKVFN